MTVKQCVSYLFALSCQFAENGNFLLFLDGFLCLLVGTAVILAAS